MKEEPANFDLDSILHELGSLGRFQQKIYLLFSIPFIFAAFFSLSYVFTAAVVPHRCVIPECESKNPSEWISFAIPPQRYDKKPEQCLRYKAIIDGSCSPEGFNRSEVIKCEEIMFETSEKTISSEWNITCDENKWKLTLVGTTNIIGQLFCIPIIGIISDRYGRKIALIIGLVLGGIFGILRAFSQNYPMFLLFEFLDTFSSSGVSNVALVLCLEYLQPQHRSLGAMTFSGIFPIGMMLIAVFAYYLQNWRYLLLSMYIPALFTISYLWLVPESLRWLHTKGKSMEILQIVQSAAKMNKVTLSQRTLDMIKTSKNEENKNQRESLLSIFKYKKMFFIVVNASFCIFTNSMVCFGLSLISVLLAGNKYLNFIFTSLIEVPAHVLGYFLIEKAGRRYSVVLCMIFAGAACIGTELLPIDATDWRFGFYMFAKLAITTSFTVIYVFATEMFPTGMRNSLLGICSMAGRVGGIIATQGPLLAQIYPPLPLLFFGGLSIISGIFSLAFPETANAKLPDTIEETLALGKYRSDEK